MEVLLRIFGDTIQTFILYFTIIICLSYVLLAILSAREMAFYLRKSKFTDYKALLSSPFIKSVSIIAPAYNEGLNIVDNIRSLLSLYYPNFEVIIVNDGSKDDTLQKMIDAYDLEKVNFSLNIQIPGKKIRGIYKSRNQAYNKLVVIDKENGGKADALNAGINVSSHPIIACIDVDCILAQDSLIKMMKPFMEENTRVIATGGVIRIANSCEIEDGRLIKVNMPNQFLPRMQVLEYIRAFLMGRMAWSRLNGLMLVSGALGFFDKEIAIACGGYNHNTVGEDMELVVRMRRYMADQNQKYKVVYVPDPLCWTEAPSDYTILGRQRNRWTRGTIETLLIHKKLFFNPKYGLFGTLSYPYWFFCEWMAPLIEFFGVIFFLCMALFGEMSWINVISLFGAVYAFAIMLSFFGIVYEEFSFRQYRRKTDILKLMFNAAVEPIIFHPLVVYWAVRGNWDFITGKKSWGAMTRTGFQTPKK